MTILAVPIFLALIIFVLLDILVEIINIIAALAVLVLPIAIAVVLALGYGVGAELLSTTAAAPYLSVIKPLYIVASIVLFLILFEFTEDEEDSDEKNLATAN